MDFERFTFLRECCLYLAFSAHAKSMCNHNLRIFEVPCFVLVNVDFHCVVFPCVYLQVMNDLNILDTGYPHLSIVRELEP